MPSLRAALPGVLVLVLLGSFWFWFTREDPEQRAVLDLPRAERTAVYRREIANFSTLCGEPVRDGLQAECRERAAFLRRFPECDARCRELVRPFERRPAR